MPAKARLPVALAPAQQRVSKHWSQGKVLTPVSDSNSRPRNESVSHSSDLDIRLMSLAAVDSVLNSRRLWTQDYCRQFESSAGFVSRQQACAAQAHAAQAHAVTIAEAGYGGLN